MNGIPLSSSNHLTGHSKYLNKLRTELDVIENADLSFDDTYEAIESLINRIKALIEANPNANLGEIADLI